ncbi:MAG: Crp/Fnr family transcriptional regulator [Clostridia bacterium]|nr:Crp/Fnr family transcriptional regulator [Clostridia bacterium]
MKSIYIEQIVKALNKTFLFSSLPDEMLSKLAYSHCEVKGYKKGELIFSDREKKKCIGVILDGEALVTKSTLVINKLSEFDMFGAITLYRSEQNFINNITAYTDCSVAFISLDGIDFLINENPDFAKKYIEYLSDRIYFLNTKIKAYTITKADEKLFSFLVSVAEGGKLYLDIKMTELAHALNLSRASLYRCFEKLESEGKIKREGKEITIL